VRNFKLYIVNDRYKVCLTNFDSSNNANSFAWTHEEELEAEENDQYTLTFSMPGYTIFDGRLTKNHYVDIAQVGAKLVLYLDDETQQINFIISSIEPELKEDNVIYSYTAQDEVSYLWSRRNVGYEFETEEVSDIYTIAKQVITENYLDKK
jgi:hypothetical protein